MICVGRTHAAGSPKVHAKTYGRVYAAGRFHCFVRISVFALVAYCKFEAASCLVLDGIALGLQPR